jgi:hypothetical protein
MAPMIIIAAILLVAVAIGYAFGGRLKAFEHLEVHWWSLAIVGLLLQGIPLPTIAQVSPRVIGTGALTLSYVLLLAFLAINRWIPGAALMAIGVLLNLVVVTINGGMPVSAVAIERAGGHVEALESSVSIKHHVATEDDLLPFLGDVIPIPEPVGIVISFGDVLLYAGMAWFVIQVMRGRSRANPRPLAMWFLAYRGKHAPSHWRMPARYRTRRAGAGTPGTGP